MSPTGGRCTPPYPKPAQGTQVPQSIPNEREEVRGNPHTFTTYAIPSRETGRKGGREGGRSMKKSKGAKSLREIKNTGEGWRDQAWQSTPQG